MPLLPGGDLQVGGEFFSLAKGTGLVLQNPIYELRGCGGSSFKMKEVKSMEAII